MRVHLESHRGSRREPAGLRGLRKEGTGAEGGPWELRRDLGVKVTAWRKERGWQGKAMLQRDRVVTKSLVLKKFTFRPSIVQ